MDEHTRSIDPGGRVFDGDGRLLGHVSAPTDDGFEILSAESDGATLPGQEFGEGYLVWRCQECGEMGSIQAGIADRCPGCGAPQEAIVNVRED